jgi:hypothetical protein
MIAIDIIRGVEDVIRREASANDPAQSLRSAFLETVL